MIRHGKLLHSFFFLIVLLAIGKSYGQAPPKEENNVTWDVHSPVSSCGLNFAIPDNSCTASSNYTISISTANGTQLGVDVVLEEVRLILAHPWDADADIYLISPNGIKVELSTDNGGGADNYGDPTDPSCSAYTTFSMKACEPISTGSAPFIGSYLPEGDLNTFNDGSNPIGDWILLICDDAPNDTGVLQFIDLIFSDNSCSPPINVQAVDIGANSVDLTWASPNPTCSSTIIEYGPPGFSPGDGPAANEGTVLSTPCGIAQPYTLNGLEELTDYDIYIREFCSPGAFSANSCLIQISTDCATASLTMVTHFDSLTLCEASCTAICPVSGSWRNVGTDDMDWLVDEGGTTSSRTGPSDDISGGGNYIYTEASGSTCVTGAQAILLSNCLQIEALSGICHLSFYYHLYGSNTGSLALEIRTETQGNWTSLFSISEDQGDEWYRSFIDLAAYHGQLAQFRFVSTRGNGFRSDMALDQIEFYGTTDASESLFTFYADTDEDGYGDPAATTGACWMNPPIGFVNNDEDCDDRSANIYPGAMEVLCNEIDENCNGSTDDTLIPAPQISDASTCMGDGLLLRPNSNAYGEFYWKADSTEGPLLGIGDSLQIAELNNSQIIFLIDSLAGGCGSSPIAVNLGVWPLPELQLGEALAICFANSYNLNDLDWTDLNQTNSSISFHSSSPANAANQIMDSIVYPIQGELFYALATSENGCTDELSFSIPLITAPTALISPAGPLEICSNGSVVLEALESSTGLAPFQYTWSNGNVGTETLVNASQVGATELFSLTVTDARGCTDYQEISLSTISSINSVAIDSLVNISFCDGTDGRIRLRPLNGIGPYRYEWSGPSTGSINSVPGAYTIENLLQGTYRVTISDNSAPGCEMIVPLLVLSGPSVVIDPFILIEEPTCAGASDGHIDIQVEADNPTFLWSNGTTSEDLNNAPAGTYSVTVSDNDCDNILQDLVIEEPTAIQADVFAITNTLCLGSVDGSIDLSVIGGMSPYTFLWSNGAVVEDITDLAEGTYDVLVTDANNCTFTLSNIQVGEPSALAIELLNSLPPSCIGASDGQIDVIISGGTAPYTYLWSDGSNSEDAIGLLEGTYQLTVTDANSCTHISAAYSINDPTALQVNLNQVQNASCEGVNDGQIDIEVSGGNGEYHFQWSTGDSTEDISNLSPGIYQLTFSDGLGCSVVSEDYLIEAPGLLSLEQIFIQEAACFGLDDGFIDVEISGGTAPYQFSWSNEATTEDIFNLGEGQYQFTVTDNNGCQFSSAMIEIGYLDALSIQTDAVLDVRCFGGGDGAIFISPPGNTPPYSFEWSNGTQTEDLLNLQPGWYTGTITDGIGCIIYTDTLTVAEPLPLSIEILSIEPASCSDAQDGSIDVQVTGGIPPYQFSWTNGRQSEDLSNADAGVYQLTVLDDQACAISSPSILIDRASDLEVEIETFDSAGCAGGDEGRIELSITGGTAPYQIAWSNGDTGLVIDKLGFGTYSVTVEDANDCQFMQSGIPIEQIRDSIAVPIEEFFGVSCAGGMDGSIIPGDIGGTPPYQYNWNNGQTDSVLVDLAIGQYQLTVTDAFGCVGISEMIVIEETTVLSFQVLTVGPVTCHGDSDGYIDVMVEGGTPPYSFVWSNGYEGEDPTDLAVGTYSLTITDSRSCNLVPIQSIMISEPDLLLLNGFQSEPASCHGKADGQLLIWVEGGHQPYSYEWSSGQTTPYLLDVAAGTYHCTVTDRYGCELITQDLSIAEPLMPLMIDLDSSTIQFEAYCKPGSGLIDLVISGGTAPYEYLWNTGDTTAAVSGLNSDIYFCFIKDANGCIIESDLLELGQSLPLSSSWTSVPTPVQEANGTATVEVSGGRAPYFYQWDNVANSQTTASAINLASGTYQVTITDSDDCLIVDTASVDFIVTTNVVSTSVELKLWPNPSSGDSYLEYAFPANGDFEVLLYSSHGQALWQRSIEKQQSGLLTIPAHLFPTGLYLVRIQQGDAVFVLKLIINKK